MPTIGSQLRGCPRPSKHSHPRGHQSSLYGHCSVSLLDRRVLYPFEWLSKGRGETSLYLVTFLSNFVVFSHVCVHVWIVVCVGACAHVDMYMQKPEVNLECHSSGCPSTLFCETASLTGLPLPDSARLASQWAPENLLSALRLLAQDCRHVLPCLILYMDVGDQNSDPHTLTTSALHTELSPLT